MTKKKETDLGFRTRAIHAGEFPDPETGASSPNLVMSSTYVVDQKLSFSAHGISEDDPHVYTRWSNPTVRQLEVKLADLEQGESCVCFGSGMAASTGLMLSLLSAGDHLVISDTNYPGTAEVARETLPRLGIDVSPVDTSRPDEIEAAMRPSTRMVWLETPANPTLRLADISAVAGIAHGHGALLAVDSTFATPVATRPLTLGADLVVHSLTKYLGGHGDAVGGAVVGSKALLTRLRTEAGIHHGGVLSPFNAWLILRGIATLPLRMKAHQENAMAVAGFLEQQVNVEQVFYPGLPSHPQHDLARRQMDNFSGMISFRVTNGEVLSQRMMESLEVIHYAVSLGHHRSLVYFLPTDDLMKSTFKMKNEALKRYRSLAGSGLFRLSVGLEDAEDLCRDLDRVLSS